MAEAIDDAIARLQQEVVSFNQGTAQQPKEGTPEWFLLRAKSAGLSMLKRLRQLGCQNDAAASERYYRTCSAVLKSKDAVE